MTLKPRRLALILLVFAALAVVVWYLSQPKPIAVVVKTVDRGRVENTVANTRAGTVTACTRAKLAPATGGQIAKLPVREGDWVKTGQPLLELWNDDLRAQVRQAETEAQAAQANVEQVCVVARQAHEDAQRLVQLHHQGLAPAETTDRALTDAQAKDAACTGAKINVQTSGTRVQTARAILERTILRAPFPGIVAKINGELGEFITPSPVGVATLPAVDLIDARCMYVEAPIDEVDAPRIRTGLTARITMDAFRGEAFQGRVNHIAPYVTEVEKQARTVDVKVLFVKPEQYRGLRPGYSADIEILLATRDNVLRVPTEAILEDDRVLVYGKDEILKSRSIKKGLANWQYTEVLQGLQVGERVVTSIDRKGVQAGAHVTPEKNSDKTTTP